MKKALKAFKENNNCYPERIILYRDNLRQHSRVIAGNEVSLINQAYQELVGEDAPLVYIHVNQVTKAEIYAQGTFEHDSYKNAVAGTVLELE